MSQQSALAGLNDELDLVNQYLGSMDLKAVVLNLRAFQSETLAAKETPEATLAFDSAKADKQLAALIGIGEYINQRVIHGKTPDNAIKAALKAASA